MMQLSFLLLSLSTVSASWFSQDSAELKHRVFSHTYELYMDARRKEYGVIGDHLIRYGWGRSGCLTGSAASKEYTRAANSFGHLNSKYDMQEATFIFYNYFLVPEQSKELLLSMISISAKDHVTFPKHGGDYVIRTGECAECDFRFPQPNMLSLSTTDCDKIKLFVDRLRYRLDNFRYDFEYYTLMAFALTNFQDVEDEIDEVPEDKLKDLFTYLGQAAQLNGFIRLENTFYEFLVFRNRKQELMLKDIEETDNPSTKAQLEEQRKYHRLMTHMMLHGWIEIYKNVAKADPELTDGKVWLTDSKRQKHGFDLPQT